MMTKRSSILLSLVLLAGCAAQSDVTAPTAVAKPAMTEEQMMANWNKMSTPTADHAYLKQLEGTWRAKTTFWKDPTSKPETSAGSAANKLVLGGRFLQQTFKGKFMGQPFEGTGLLGFDNAKGAYTSVWADSMSTQILQSSGSRDIARDELVMRGEFTCPLTNEPHRTREVTKVLDKNHYAFTMYDAGPDGKEYKTMEIAFTRR